MAEMCLGGGLKPFDGASSKTQMGLGLELSVFLLHFLTMTQLVRLNLGCHLQSNGKTGRSLSANEREEQPKNKQTLTAWRFFRSIA